MCNTCKDRESCSFKIVVQQDVTSSAGLDFCLRDHALKTAQQRREVQANAA